MLTDGGGAEGVCFNDIRASFQILGVDLCDDFRTGELEQFEIALEMFRLMGREARASVLFLGELVALHHRAHRAIEQDDALAEKGFKRMNGGGGHGEAAINDRGEQSATNKLTYHDTSMRYVRWEGFLCFDLGTAFSLIGGARAGLLPRLRASFYAPVKVR